jgi:hypothetical protein
VGDPSKAERLLGWIRNHDFDKLIESMVQAELQNIQATKSQRRGPEMAINGGRQPPTPSKNHPIIRKGNQATATSAFASY